MILIPAVLITLITNFLGLVSEEAAAAYKRKKAAEAAQAAAKQAAAEKARLEREAKEKAEEAALAKAKLDNLMARIAEAERVATLARNEADLRAMLVPIDDNPYGDSDV